MISQSSAASHDIRKMVEFHPAFYIICWITISNVTIIFNKWLLDTAGFPILLTTLHLSVATVLTQLMSRLTPSLLNVRSSIKVTGRIYLRAILPIGILYTVSLVCSNQTYLYLSVSFIQMLKAFAPVSTLFVSFFMGMSNPKVSVLWTVLVIALGVVLSSLGEVWFSWTGFGFQMSGTVAESLRLLLIQKLLARPEGADGVAAKGMGMDPLVGLYYYAPICAVMNGAVALLIEVPTFQWTDLERVGWGVLGLNGLLAFLLNVTSVFLIGRTSALAMNLTGIFKSILLVVASMMIWKTPVTLLQAVGYAIALAGMAYYSVGPEAARGYIESCKSWFSGTTGRSSANGSLHEGLLDGTEVRSPSSWLRRLRNASSIPWGEYTRVESDASKIIDQERGAVEAEHEPKNVWVAGEGKSEHKQG